MNKYIDCGIVKSVTIFYKREDDLTEIYNFLAEKLDLNLFDIRNESNCIFLDIKKEIINSNFLDLLTELKYKELLINDSIDYNIKIISKMKDKDIDLIIKDCDDIFINTFNFNDTSILSNLLYDIEIEYITIYFDGPFKGKNFSNLIELIYSLLRNNLTNILKDAICLGITTLE